MSEDALTYPVFADPKAGQNQFQEHAVQGSALSFLWRIFLAFFNDQLGSDPAIPIIYSDRIQR
jgi:hypothetical protein